jgi:hypothetical protein
MISEAAAAVVHKNIAGGDCLAVRNGAKPVGDEGMEHRVHRVREEIGGSVSARSAGAYTAILHVMVTIVKGGGRAPPTLPAWANFSITMECTPGSGRCRSVCTLWCGVFAHPQKPCVWILGW